MKNYTLNDCVKKPMNEVKKGDIICLSWKGQDDTLKGVRFYSVDDIIKGHLFLKTEEGKEYPTRVDPFKNCLIVVNL